MKLWDIIEVKLENAGYKNCFQIDIYSFTIVVNEINKYKNLFNQIYYMKQEHTLFTAELYRLLHNFNFLTIKPLDYYDYLLKSYIEYKVENKYNYCPVFLGEIIEMTQKFDIEEAYELIEKYNERVNK